MEDYLSTNIGLTSNIVATRQILGVQPCWVTTNLSMQNVWAQKSASVYQHNWALSCRSSLEDILHADVHLGGKIFWVEGFWYFGSLNQSDPPQVIFLFLTVRAVFPAVIVILVLIAFHCSVLFRQGMHSGR